MKKSDIKVGFVSLGCPKNQLDTEVMLAHIAQAGYTVTPEESEADVVIAKGIGCTLPLLAKAIHLDPALMASPIITTVVDATSLAVLFLIATRIFSLG